MWFRVACGCIVSFEPDVDVLAIIVGIVGAAFFDLGIRRLDKVGVTTNEIYLRRVTTASTLAIVACAPLPHQLAASNGGHGLHD